MAVADDIEEDALASRGVSPTPKRPFTAVDGERRIRSFVLREGRQTQSQQRAMTDAWPRFGIDYQGHQRDFDAVFGRTAKRVLEIGFGNGDALLHAASSDTARDYIGIEVHAPGVGRVLNATATANLSNLRVYRHDAVEVLHNELTAGSLDEVRIWFPDPWHKKRHHKRRLVNPDFAALLASRIRVGGLLHLATDWQDYAEQMWNVLDAQKELQNRFGVRGSCARPDWRRQTRFETRGLGLGHTVRDLLYDRINATA